MVDDIIVDNCLKLLSCVFSDAIRCSYRKDVGFRIMGRCFKCPEWKRFEAEMDIEDERMMDEIDDIREHPELHPDWYPSGAPR